MREAGEVYLPRHREESDVGYKERLEAAVLLNLTEQTLNTLSSKPFKEPIALGEDVPEAIEDGVLPDVDLLGNDLTVFCQQWFREGIAKAFAHVLVDITPTEGREPGKPWTLDDARKAGQRPFWTLVPPECVIFASCRVVGGREVLDHVRILEEYAEIDGYAEVKKARIRVLTPGKVTILIPGTKKGRWVEEDSWETGLDYIPLVTFYADREAPFVGKPPLLDLAYLNVAHWQSTSDQRHILSVSRFPILACSGANGEDSSTVVIGPNKILYVPDPKGSFYYVEHSGAAIEAGAKDLAALEEQMAGYGAEFLRKRPGSPTATARALDSAESCSLLGSMAVCFEDAVAQALDITADWLGLEGGAGGRITVAKDFDLTGEDSAGLDALEKARARRDISRKAYIAGLKARKVLPEEYDEEEDMEELMEESPGLMGGGV
jgi:hypothetical protein